MEPIHSHPELLESLRNIIDSRFDKFEQGVELSINRLSDKIDDVKASQSTDRERIIRVEGIVDSCDKSRETQGRRLGELSLDLERLRMAVKTKEETTRQVRGEAGAWVRWIPTLIGTLLLIASFIVANTK